MWVHTIRLLDWAIIATSFFNTITLLWVGLTVLLNAERRTWGTWIAGGGLLLGGVFYAGHSAVVGRVLGTFTGEMEFWWRITWLPIVGMPYLWYLMILWYTGVLRARRHRGWLCIVSLIGLTDLLLLAVANPLPTFSEVLERTPGSIFSLAGIPVVALVYPVFSVLCIVLSLSALRRPEASQRFMGDLGRRRARPWLVSASLALLGVSLVVGVAIAWFLSRVEMQVSPLYFIYKLPYLMGFDLLISSLVAAASILTGRAVVAYEIFTGKTLPRGGLLLQWRRSLMLAAGYSALVGLSLSIIPLDPIYQLLLATTLMTSFFALASWRSYAGRERSMERLRPFVASQRLYERLLAPATPPEIDVSAPFRALCDEVLSARLGFLIPLGPLAPLAGTGLAYPAGSPLPALGDLPARLRSPQTLCLPLEPQRYGGAVWAVPLWSERGLIGVLLLGEKHAEALYTQEEIEIARTTGERLIDVLASGEMSRRLMALQRHQLAESQILDRRTRRVLHDDVLPRLHTAMLMLSGVSAAARAPAVADAGAQVPAPDQLEREGSSAATVREAVSLLAETHRQIADLLHAMPAYAAPEVARLGLFAALRQAVERELAAAFDVVSWHIDSECEDVARAMPPLTAETLYYAAREAVRNAARYGRDGDPARPLHLSISAAWREGLELIIEDNGVGMGSGGAQREGSGQGLALHSTMLAVVGGSLSVDSLPGAYTRITLALPRSICAAASQELALPE